MSDTAQLFILAGIWTLVAAVLVYFIPKWPVRVVVFALLVGAPFWELPYGFLNFKNLCENQGGFRAIEAVTPQKIVCLRYPNDNLAQRFLELGFHSVERIDRNGKSSALTRDLAGLATGASAYCVTHAFVQNLPWWIQRNEYSVVQTSNEKVVARFSDFVWFGTWWQQAALPVLGRGGECRHGDPTPTIANWLIAGSK